MGGQVARALGTGFALSPTVVVDGVRSLSGNIEVAGQPAERASTIAAQVKAMRRGAQRHQSGNTMVAHESCGFWKRRHL